MTQSVAELLGRALNSHQQGRLPEAERFYTEVLKIEADHFDALHLLGVLKQQNGESAEALRLIAAALKTDATPDALTNYGNILCSLDRHQEGLAFYERALALKPDDILALANRGAALTALNRPEEALACYDRVLAMQPDYAAVHYNRGNALRALKRPREALASYDRALALRPDETGALLNRANALAELGRHEEALTCYDRLLQLMPGNTDALNNRGTSLVALNRPEAALASYDNALALNPGHAGAHYNRGHALRQLKRYDDALSAYDAALAINPNFADALYGRANALKEARRYEEAISAYEKALTIAPDHPNAALGMFDAALAVCDWTRTRKMMGELKAQILQGKPYNPFTLLSCSDDAALHLRAAQNSIRHAIPAPPAPLWKGTIFRHDKIRLGYLSADFHPHPMASLLAELFERHDRTRFEVTGISLDQAGDSEIRRRLVAGFDRFHDVRTKSDGHIASLLRDLEIDIAVDLNGHTLDGRPGVLALRPAPIQVNYLGYPGTIGADFIDYVIADRIVLPFDQQPFYSERIIHLPDCYQVNDSKRKISEQTPTRREAGLPDEGFVFCCFNNNHKITEAVFDIWMRLLKNIPGSVLWLLQDSVGAQDNLRKEAQARGVDSARLIDAGRLPLDQHLARHRLAGLFLDTLPYNAHTTGSDALWAGLPVLTCQGNTFAARVAASLLLAVGLEELVTHNLEGYEAQALRLATEPSLLGDIRRKLEQNRQTHPLFDTGRFCRHIEAAYTGMWEIWQRGGSPRSFAVETIPSRSAA